MEGRMGDCIIRYFPPQVERGISEMVFFGFVDFRIAFWASVGVAGLCATQAGAAAYAAYGLRRLGWGYIRLPL